MLNRDELIALVRRIKEGDYASEQEADSDVEKLSENVIDPSAIDYVFQQKYDDLSPEEIADKILQYEPICLLVFTR